MKISLIDFFKKFDIKYSTLEFVDSDWYKTNCGVFANCKKTNCKDIKGNYSEEWYKARMAWSLVESKKFPPENICVEFTIPKGSEGAKSLNPDMVVFKSDNWLQYYEKWDKKSSVPEKLRENFLVFWEAKNIPSKIETPVKKQLESAMEGYIGEQVFGVYFDNQDDIIIFKKEGTNPIKRYNIDKIIDGEGIEKLNLSNRDNLNDLPDFTKFLQNITASDDVSKLNFNTNQPIDEDSFSELFEVINRMQDRLNVSQVQNLIVEFLTLKVSDEKDVKKGNKESFEFYIKPDEMIKLGFGSQSFRNRIEFLYKKTKEEYKSIFNPRVFVYQKKGSDLVPLNGDDEKFLIGLIQVFQKKTILETQNASFNQIIFNNFGNNIEKAKEKQFFTPIPIVESMVKMINPQKNETICDPCAGICDFLAMAFRHIYKDELGSLPTAEKFYAFDKDNKILKLAELNLVLNGDGCANIKIMNSIPDKLLLDGSFKEIDFTTDSYHKEDWSNKNDENKNPRKYKVIITNPPFGKGRNLKTGSEGKWDFPKKTIELYEAWEVSGKPLSMDMGVIFLENAYKLLEDGGRMAIVVSNSIAGVSEWKQAREWFISRMRIVAIFDLPAGTFGETDVATTVIVAYKPKISEAKILKEDYEFYIKEIEHVGYTVKIKDRIVIMSPDFVINEDSFKRATDSKGNNKRLTDLPNLVNDFYKWLQDNKHKYKEIYKAFHGNSFQIWEE